MRLDEGESLTAAQLRGWLDVYQASNRQVTTVLEFSGSGDGFPRSRAVGRERLCVASAGPEQASLCANGGS